MPTDATSDKARKPNRWYNLTLPLGLAFSFMVGLYTALQPFHTLKAGLAGLSTYLGLAISAFTFNVILAGILLIGVALWSVLYGKDILASIYNWHANIAGKKVDFSRWYNQVARIIGSINVYVNGLGVLYGAIGTLGLVQIAFGYPGILALPLALRIFALVTGFLSGAIAAGTLTYSSLFENIRTIKQKWKEGLTWTDTLKMTLALFAAIGLAAFNAEAGLQATNCLYLLFNIDMGLRPALYLFVAHFNQILSGISTFFCAGSFFLKYSIGEDKNGLVGVLTFLLLGGLTWLATTEMIGALILQEGSIWVGLLGTGLPLYAFAAVVTTSCAYLLYRLFDAATKELRGFAWSLIPSSTTPAHDRQQTPTAAGIAATGSTIMPVATDDATATRPELDWKELWEGPTGITAGGN